MKILITDITDMSDGMHCVAGWCVAEKRMVRPLPDGHHWSNAWIAKHGVDVGSTIEVVPIGKAHLGDFPHSTEDLDILPGQIEVVDKMAPSQVISVVPVSAKNLSGTFGGNLRLDNPFRGTAQKLWVPVGVQCPSLVGINLLKGSVSFSENTYDPKKPKLRAKISSREEHFQFVEVAVSCSALKSAWRSGGLAAANAALPATMRWHLRLGLARAFDGQPNQCSLMLNGVL